MQNNTVKQRLISKFKFQKLAFKSHMTEIHTHVGLQGQIIFTYKSQVCLVVLLISKAPLFTVRL